MTGQHKDSSWLASTALVLLLLAGAAAMLFVTYKAMAQTPRTATITFTRAEKYTDGTDIPATLPLSYEVWQGPRGACAFTDGTVATGYAGVAVSATCKKTKVGTITSTSTTINTGLQPGESCWQIATIANGVRGQLSAESAPGATANSTCKTFAFPAPETVTITVT
jgi:hypothetical protein